MELGLALTLPGLIAALFPWRWGLRIGIALWMIGLGMALSAPNVPLEARGAMHGLARFLIGCALLSGLAGVLLRQIVDALRGRMVEGLPFRGQGAMRRVDALLALALGGMVGAGGTAAAALALRGQSGGLVLHLALAGLALVAAGLVLTRLRGQPARIALAAGVSFAALVTAGGFFYPELIRARAAQVPGGVESCLRSGAGLAREDELRLLTLPAASAEAPGLMLTVLSPEGPRHYRWSHRGSRFFPHLRSSLGACPPAPALP